MADKVVDYGVSMVAIGRTLIVNPEWVELTQNGEEDKITSILKLETVKEKKIPSKLMTIFEKIEGWVQVEA